MLNWRPLARLFVMCILILVLALTVAEGFGPMDPVLWVAALIVLAIVAGVGAGTISNLVRRRRAAAETRERP